MRKLLNTLYVTSRDNYLSLDGENVVVRSNGNEKFRIPLHNLEGIVSFGYTGASPALMGACAERSISLCFMTEGGRFLARVVGKVRGNVVLRKIQYDRSQSETDSTAVAKNMITGKLFNARWVIERAARDHSLRLDADKLRCVSRHIRETMGCVQSAENLDELRGYEGVAASAYFSVLDDLILQQKESFRFSGRTRRPPTDRFNALLSFAYTLLANETASALEAVGLDPYVGFLHRDRPGRISLALDLVEEFRPVYADRFVLTIVNRREVAGDGFAVRENGAVMMDDSTRKTVLAAWQARKQEHITHPYLQEKIPWGLVPYVQALLLARFLRGDLDAYPPFMWK